MRWFLRRLAQLVVVVAVVTFLTAFMVNLLPGDLCKTQIPVDDAKETLRKECRVQNHLDDNLVVRYGYWAKGFVTGDMGSYYTGVGTAGDPVFKRVKAALPTSLLIVFYVQLLTLLVAIPLGVYSAYRSGSWFDRGGNGFAFGLVALPTFVLAAMLKFQLGLKWAWFPTIGYVGPTSGLAEHFKSVAMPVLTLAVGQIAIYSRLLRSDMIATLQEDYILMAKAKGIPNRKILWRHALRPSSLTLLTVAGLNIGALVSGALIVERIFNIDGIGGLLYEAVGRRQYIPLQSLVAIVAILYVVINFFVDLLYSALDPRIRNA